MTGWSFCFAFLQGQLKSDDAVLVRPLPTRWDKDSTNSRYSSSNQSYLLISTSQGFSLIQPLGWSPKQVRLSPLRTQPKEIRGWGRGEVELPGVFTHEVTHQQMFPKPSTQFLSLQNENTVGQLQPVSDPCSSIPGIISSGSCSDRTWRECSQPGIAAGQQAESPLRAESLLGCHCFRREGLSTQC